jgi:hypothetical protein
MIMMVVTVKVVQLVAPQAVVVKTVKTAYMTLPLMVVNVVILHGVSMVLTVLI